jgi:hypothetical protein
MRSQFRACRDDYAVETLVRVALDRFGFAWHDARAEISLCQLPRKYRYVEGAPGSQVFSEPGLGVFVEFFREEWCGRVDSNHHGIATASPSSWCVCQFRHDRVSELYKYKREANRLRATSRTLQIGRAFVRVPSPAMISPWLCNFLKTRFASSVA